MEARLEALDQGYSCSLLTCSKIMHGYLWWPLSILGPNEQHLIFRAFQQALLEIH